MTTSVFIATSLDGFIARPDGAIDWLPAPDDEDYGYEAFIGAIDVLVMGRHTYETVLGFGAWPYALPVVDVRSYPTGLVQRQYAARPTKRRYVPSS